MLAIFAVFIGPRSELVGTRVVAQIRSAAPHNESQHHFRWGFSRTPKIHILLGPVPNHVRELSEEIFFVNLEFSSHDSTNLIRLRVIPLKISGLIRCENLSGHCPDLPAF